MFGASFLRKWCDIEAELNVPSHVFKGQNPVSVWGMEYIIKGRSQAVRKLLQ